MTKKISVLATLCLLLGCLSACGDDDGTKPSGGEGGEGSSDSNGSHAGGSSAGSSRSGRSSNSDAVYDVGGGVVIEVASDSVFYSVRMEGTVVSHNALARRLVVRYPGEERCRIFDDGSVSWETAAPTFDTLAYAFDALSAENEALIVEEQGFRVRNHSVLYMGELDEEDGTEYQVWVGGDRSSLFGVWDRAYCSYDEGAPLTCKTAEEIARDGWNYPLRTTISADKVVDEARIAVSRDSRYGDRPFLSMFMNGLYMALKDGVDASYMYGIYTAMGLLDASHLFETDSAEVAGRIESAGVVVRSQTDDAQTFEMGGRSYTVRILESSAAGVDFSADVEVSSGGRSCRIKSRQIGRVDESLCDAKNVEDFEWDIEFGEDFDFETNFDYTVYPTEINRNNRDEYRECLNGIALTQVDLSEDNEPAAVPAPPADASAKAVRRKAPARLKKLDSFFRKK